MTKRQIIYVQFTEDKTLKFVFGLKNLGFVYFHPFPYFLIVHPNCTKNGNEFPTVTLTQRLLVSPSDWRS